MTPKTPGWLEPFSRPVADAVLRVLDGAPGRRTACFDADGTLWSEDIGEASFRFLLAGGALPALPGADAEAVYRDYEARVDADRATGYAWAVQCMAGVAEADVRRWSRQMAYAWPNYRPAMIGLLRGLADAGVEVWVVSASSAWVVRAAVARYGVAPDRVIAMESVVRDGVLTDEMVRPLICLAGKVSAIDRYIGVRPDLAAGDSTGDLAMLQAAREPIVIGRNDQPDNALVREAQACGWPVHKF